MANVCPTHRYLRAKAKQKDLALIALASVLHSASRTQDAMTLTQMAIQVGC